MKKYGDMWAYKDNDHLWYIAYYLYGDGHIRVKPFSFKNKNNADHYVNTEKSKSIIPRV